MEQLAPRIVINMKLMEMTIRGSIAKTTMPTDIRHKLSPLAVPSVSEREGDKVYLADAHLWDADFDDTESRFLDTADSLYLSRLISHEGPVSILAYLKAKGWATGLGAGGYSLCPSSGVFHISVKLTEDGVSNFQEVFKTTIPYIAKICEHESQERIVKEQKTTSEVGIAFDYPFLTSLLTEAASYSRHRDSKGSNEFRRKADRSSVAMKSPFDLRFKSRFKHRVRESSDFSSARTQYSVEGDVNGTP